MSLEGKSYVREFRQSRLGVLFFQLVQFGLVGGVGFVVNFVLFNLLRAGPLNPDQVANGSMYAATIAACIAIVVNWIGNRYWTFSEHRGAGTLREGIEFFAVSLAGSGIGLLCLWISHNVLGYTSAVADNIAINVVGLALGSLFRFVLYRLWVFSPRRHEARLAARTDHVAQHAVRTPAFDSTEKDLSETVRD